MSNWGSYTVLHQSLDCLYKICGSAAVERGNRGKGGQKGGLRKTEGWLSSKK